MYTQGDKPVSSEERGIGQGYPILFSPSLKTPYRRNSVYLLSVPLFAFPQYTRGMNPGKVVKKGRWQTRISVGEDHSR